MKTNIISFSEDLQMRMQRIDELSDEDILIRTGKQLTNAQNLILELKQFTSHYVFNDVHEEIRFFKETKPVLLRPIFLSQKNF